MNANPAYLRIVLYLLSDIGDINAFPGLSREQLASFSRDYTPDETREIVTSLQFAEAHPDYDFNSLAPHDRFSNRQLHVFLKRVLDSMANPKAE